MNTVFQNFLGAYHLIAAIIAKPCHSYFSAFFCCFEILYVIPFQIEYWVSHVDYEPMSYGTTNLSLVLLRIFGAS